MLKSSLLEKGSLIGTNVFFGNNVYIDQGFERFLEIEDGVVLAANVSIFLHDSSLNNIMGLPIKVSKVKICKNAYVGANTTILCGVEIGEESLVGAKSLVTKTISPNKVAYGVPAKEICSLSDFKDLYISKMSGESKCFYWDIIPWKDRSQNMTPADEQSSYFEFLYLNRNNLFIEAPHNLDFENKNTTRYLLFGWHSLENWPPAIRWTSSKASAYLKSDQKSTKLFIKAITYYPNINAKISIDKQFIKAFSFNDIEWKVLEIDLPDFDMNIIEVLIEVDKTWIPDEVMKNGDTRQLGIAVHKIWLE